MTDLPIFLFPEPSDNLLDPRGYCRKAWVDLPNHDVLFKQPRIKSWSIELDWTLSEENLNDDIKRRHLKFVNKWLAIDRMALTVCIRPEFFTGYSNGWITKRYRKKIKQKYVSNIVVTPKPQTKKDKIQLRYYPSYNAFMIEFTVGNVAFTKRLPSYSSRLTTDFIVSICNKINEVLQTHGIDDIYPPQYFNVSKMELFRDIRMDDQLISYYLDYFDSLPITSTRIINSEEYKNTKYREYKTFSGITFYRKKPGLLRVEARLRKSNQVKYATISEESEFLKYHGNTFASIIHNQHFLFPEIFNRALKSARVPRSLAVAPGGSRKFLEIIRTHKGIHTSTYKDIKNYLSKPAKPPLNSKQGAKYRKLVSRIEEITGFTPALGIKDGPILDFSFLYDDSADGLNTMSLQTRVDN